MKKRNVILLGVTLSIVMFALGFFFGGTRNYTEAGLVVPGAELGLPQHVDTKPIWKAWHLLDEKFVPATTTEQITDQDKVWGAISGIAAAYNDPYTVFLSPKEYKQFNQEISGAFGGVGIEIGIRNNILTVIAPLKDTPADRAGIRAGDLIVEIDGESTQNMTIDDAVLKIRGEVGTEVTFTIARKGDAGFLTIPVVRDIVEIPTGKYEVKDDGTFVISLYNFGGTATKEMRKALRAFIQSGGDKLIIDLRDNPGGYLEAAVDIASWFLPAGKTVVVEDFGEKQKQVLHRSKGHDISKDTWRIAVLIDKGSASASEILAGALKEHGKAVLIGEKSFGKGSVQELVQLTPETSLKITVARWLTPLGHTISHNGLTPDLTVPITSQDIKEGRDPQMDAALEYVRTGVLPQTHATSSTSIFEDLKQRGN